MQANILWLAGTLLILGGCAAIERQEAADTEKLLAAAGFEGGISDLWARGDRKAWW